MPFDRPRRPNGRQRVLDCESHGSRSLGLMRVACHRMRVRWCVRRTLPLQWLTECGRRVSPCGDRDCATYRAVHWWRQVVMCKDPALQQPNGFAWVLMEAPPQRRLQAVLFPHGRLCLSPVCILCTKAPVHSTVSCGLPPPLGSLGSAARGFAAALLKPRPMLARPLGQNAARSSRQRCLACPTPRVPLYAARGFRWFQTE